MFRYLRLRLTLLYLLGGLLLVGAVCAVVYLLLHDQYRRSIDLALEHRAALALHEVGETLPAALAQGELEWYAERGGILPTLIHESTEEQDDENGGVEATLAIPAVSSAAARDSSEEEEDKENGDDGELRVVPAVPSATARDSSGEEDAANGNCGETPAAPAITSASIWHADEAEFDAELSPIALTAVGQDGGVDNLTGGKNYFFDPAAIEAARTGGIDLRTAVNSDGHRIRVLSIRLSGVPGYAALQVSRSLADQDLIMAELVRGLLQWGVVFALVLAAVSWWLSGRALRSAQIAWDKQQAFIAHAGHELRTPLTMIRAAAEITQRKLPPDDSRRGPVTAIIAEADRMGRLVGDLLLLSRLDAHALRVELHPVDLAPMVDEIAVSFGRVAQERGVELRTGPVQGMARADAGRLRQVLLILLDNALRHAPEGSALEIESGSTGGKILLTVRDHGAGISPEDLPHVFDRFYRGRSVTPESGSGLGLTIAKELVEAMNGRIRISGEPGQGTTATVELSAEG